MSKRANEKVAIDWNQVVKSNVSSERETQSKESIPEVILLRYVIERRRFHVGIEEGVFWRERLPLELRKQILVVVVIEQADDFTCNLFLARLGLRCRRRDDGDSTGELREGESEVRSHLS